MSEIITETKTLDILSSLTAAIGHDAKATAMIAELSKHLRDSRSVLRALGGKIERKYNFETCEIDGSAGFSEFSDLLESTVAQVGQVFAMAREAAVTDAEMTYLRSRLTEATEGHFAADTSRVRILSHVQVVETAVAASFEPIVEMAQRVLRVETPTTRYKPEQIEHTIALKEGLIERLTALIDAYDPEVGKRFAEETKNKIEIERGRLEQFTRSGMIDPMVEISPVLDDYEDQLRLNIMQFESVLARGAPETEAWARASNEVEVLRSEVAALRLSLKPIKEKTPSGVDTLPEAVIAEAVACNDKIQELADRQKPHFGNGRNPVFPKRTHDEQIEFEREQMKRFIQVVSPFGVTVDTDSLDQIKFVDCLEEVLYEIGVDDEPTSRSR